MVNKQEIFLFMSKHEAQVAEDMECSGIEARFTTFGNQAACKAIYEILQCLDAENLRKVNEVMIRKTIKNGRKS